MNIYHDSSFGKVHVLPHCAASAPLSHAYPAPPPIWPYFPAPLPASEPGIDELHPWASLFSDCQMGLTKARHSWNIQGSGLSPLPALRALVSRVAALLHQMAHVLLGAPLLWLQFPLGSSTQVPFPFASPGQRVMKASSDGDRSFTISF